MIRLRPSGADEVLIKRVRDWYEPGPGVFFTGVTGTASFSPAMLFTGSTTGVWYDPSDMTTLFQDAAGTTPVTAMEQPVGLMLDKSGRGNHATQSTAGNRPTLSARYNLLTKTEQFNDAYWTKDRMQPFGSGSIANTTETTDPLGGNTADKLVENTVAGDHILYPSAGVALAAAQHTFSIRVKAAGRTKVRVSLATASLAYGASVIADLTSGNTDPVQNYGGHVGGSASCNGLGNGWYVVSLSVTATATTYYAAIAFVTGTSTVSYTGDGTSGIYIWGADLRVANDALNQPAYQRVNTATDYDTVGFKPYLRFNGTSSAMQTNSIDFSYGDKMFVSAGLRYLSAASAILVEEGNGSVTPSFSIWSAAAQTFFYSSQGSGSAQSSAVSVSYPATIVGTGDSSVSSPYVKARVNGGAYVTNTGSQGAGNYGNTPLYIGARAGSSLWFNGRLYQMAVAGKQASASEITDTETYLNTKTGAY